MAGAPLVGSLILWLSGAAVSSPASSVLVAQPVQAPSEGDLVIQGGRLRDGMEDQAPALSTRRGRWASPSRAMDGRTTDEWKGYGMPGGRVRTRGSGS